MIVPENKIRVFISSACGDAPEKQKYNYVREALKVLIESMGFAKTYVFESEGASTLSAGEHYTFSLEDSDICIFIIDNKDGVPNGVQNEIDTAKKHNIKSLFYFCDQFERTETPLQKSLKGSQYAKSVTVHDFKDIIKVGSKDLVNDLIEIYRNYCKGRLSWIEESTAVNQSENSDLKLLYYSDNVIDKDLLSNIDYCRQYFSKFILGTSVEKIDSTSGLDKMGVEFLPVLFEGAGFDKEKMSIFLTELKKHQSPEHFSVTEKRYEAIGALFSGKQKCCISKLQDALKLAKEVYLPEWLKEDILIDLRNEEISLKRGENDFFINSEYQTELLNSNRPLHYPILDRLISNYQRDILIECIKDRTRLPTIVSFGDTLLEQIGFLAEIYLIALYNGSLTHMQSIYMHLKHLCFYGASKFSDWNIKKTLLKTSILYGKQEETDGIIKCFGDLLSKMDENDANEIYQFTNNVRVPYKRVITKLEAFRVIAYFLDNESFNSIWSEIRGLIAEWLEDEDSSILVGEKIFSTLEQTHLRISQDEIIGIICKCFNDNKKRFYTEIFKLIEKCVDLNSASPELVEDLLGFVIQIVKNADQRNKIYTLESALFTLRKQSRLLTDELDKAISIEMPTFYNSEYLLETTENETKDFPSFIESSVIEIRKDNKERGENKKYYKMENRPHITIKNILRYSSVDYSEKLMDSVFRVSCETLLSEKQDIEIKIEAIELLVYLLRSNEGIKARNQAYVSRLLNNKETVVKAQAVLTNLKGANLKLSALILYYCLDEDIIMELINVLANIGGDALSNRNASATFLNYIEANRLPLSDFQLEQIVLQKSIEWCNVSDVTTRWNAVQILFFLLRNRKNKDVVCNQLVNLIDVDNVYIKNKILRNLYLLKDVDYETYKYIIQKASIDKNYVVRKVVHEIKQESTV